MIIGLLQDFIANFHYFYAQNNIDKSFRGGRSIVAENERVTSLHKGMVRSDFSAKFTKFIAV